MTGELVGSHERFKTNYTGLSVDNKFKNFFNYCFIQKV